MITTALNFVQLEGDNILSSYVTYKRIACTVMLSKPIFEVRSFPIHLYGPNGQQLPYLGSHLFVGSFQFLHSL